MATQEKFSAEFAETERIVVFPGDCLDLLKLVPDQSLRLVVTSPPYNIGKEYEHKLELNAYMEQQAAFIKACVRTLSDSEVLSRHGG